MRLFLNAAEFAQMIKVHRSTVIRWLNKGMIVGATKVNGTRAWKIPLASYERFVNNTQKK